MPAVHYSSFEAGAAVPGEATGDPVINGFLEQCRHVCVGVEAAIRRSLTEGWSMVLEGVHLVPGLVPAELDGALLLHVLVAIDDEGAHRAHFMIRDATTGGVRPMNHYLDGIDRIRRVQSYVLSRARHERVPVIENTNVERTIGEVIELVLQLAAREHEPA
jgi:2-phosphoglycerate kinase